MPASADRTRPLWRRLLGPFLSLLLLAAVFFWFLPQFTSISDVWTSVKSMSTAEVAILLLAAVWNLATYQFVVTSTMPGLTFGQATVSTEILSDREGLQRFERVTRTTPHFEGERYYRFDGGCITFEFRLAGESRGEGLALATSAVGVISRADLIEQVHEDSDGRLSLDPAAAEGEP